MVTLIWPISQSFDRKKDWHPQRKVELHLESAFDLSCNINTFPSLMPTCYLVDFEFISFNHHANQFLKILYSLSLSLSSPWPTHTIHNIFSWKTLANTQDLLQKQTPQHSRNTKKTKQKNTKNKKKKKCSFWLTQVADG